MVIFRQFLGHHSADQIMKRAYAAGTADAIAQYQQTKPGIIGITKLKTTGLVGFIVGKLMSPFYNFMLTPNYP
ncbi:MAG TPA: hypothetical protein VFW90_03475 [Candidatus Saccharimonadales bacterium]|nr:hypothetical protein [Candidatus Saccharimonadales bacterium]